MMSGNLNDVYVQNNVYDQLEAAGHVLQLDNGTGCVDRFALSHGFHNGPYCTRCGKSWCAHCLRDIPQCVPHEIGGATCNTKN